MENLQEFEQLIRKIPKSDLHLHLDGSVRPQTIIDISKKEKLVLPSYTVEGLNETVFKDRYESLEEYLKTFGYSSAVMQKPEYLEQIAYELACDVQAEGVRYIEVRFAPQLHINPRMDLKTVLESVNKGLQRSQAEFNRRPEIRNGSQPPFYYGIIVCAMRFLGPWSDYYRNFINTFSFSSNVEISRMASLELAKGAIKLRNEYGIPIAGFDLAGAEAGSPASRFWESFQFVHESFMPKTVHAGEAYGPESIFQAITDLHADRIGHGYYLFDTSKIKNPKITDKKKYISDLSQYVANRRITIEVCLTSNMQTNPTIGEVRHHTFGKMMEHKLSVTLCTDNRTVSKTSLTQEIMLAVNNFPLSSKTLKNCIVYGFKRSFFPGDYSEKRKYVRQCLEYYEELTRDVPELRS
ncbi:adenosine deaminase family protein [bacterium]|nr:adenosine deaminase family protein [bacterium]